MAQRKLVPREYGSGTLTKAGRHAKIVSGLRNANKYWKPKMEVRKKASVGKKINVDTGRLAEHFKCACCKEDFPAKKIQLDHIIPLVDACGFVDWGDYIERMFVEEHGWQVLCLECHKEKTNKEKAARAAYKKEHKDDDN